MAVLLTLCAVSSSLIGALARAPDAPASLLQALEDSGRTVYAVQHRAGVWPYPEGLEKLLQKGPSEIVDEEVAARDAVDLKAARMPRDIPASWPSSPSKDSAGRSSLVRSEGGGSLEEKSKHESMDEALEVGSATHRAKHPHVVHATSTSAPPSPDEDLLAARKRRVVMCSLLMAILAAFLLGITTMVPASGVPAEFFADLKLEKTWALIQQNFKRAGKDGKTLATGGTAAKTEQKQEEEEPESPASDKPDAFAEAVSGLWGKDAKGLALSPSTK